MSVLPVEEQPSGAVPADTGSGPRGPRFRPGGAAARPAVHPLFPARKWLLPDGDCIFPGGGRTFPGPAAPGDCRTIRGQAVPADDRMFPGPAAPADVRPGRAAGSGAQRAARPSAGAGRTSDVRRTIRPSAAAQRSVQPLTSVPVLSGPVLSGPVVPAAGRATGAAASHRLRLTRRGRIMLAVLAVLLVCGLSVTGAGAAQASAPASAHGGSGVAERVIVQPGDTLWSIAQSAAPDADARTIVQEILQANRLTTANITAGQRLWVPRG
jgi:LysM repeat protein